MSRVTCGLLLCWLLSAGWFAVPDIAEAQRIDHQPPAGIETGKAEELVFHLTGISGAEIYEAVLFFREEGQFSYERTRAEVDHDEVMAELVAPEHYAGAMEYYLVLELHSGEQITYPQQLPSEEPLSAIVTEQRDEEPLTGIAGQVDYNILSPQPGEELPVDDVLLAITLFYESGVANADSFRVYFAGEDVTAQADISPFFISYVPQNMRTGNYTVEVAYIEDGTETTLMNWQFSVAERTLAEEQEQIRRMPTGRLELDGRNQNVAGFHREVYRGRLRLSGDLNENIRYGFNGLLTNQESSRLQPRNRFGGELYIGDWFRLDAGHVYPSLNSLTITGRKMYGVNAEVSLWSGNLAIEGVYGNIARGITNQYTALQKISDEDDQEPIFSMGFDQGGRGMYERRIGGGRLSIGSGDRFQFGLNALKVEDDIHSIDIVEDLDDLSDEDLQNLSSEDRSLLEQNPELFQFEGSHPNPTGNFIFATDVQARADNNRISFNTDAGLSLVNQNIRNPLDQERADELGIDLDSDIESTLDLLSNLIIINENMSVRPFDIEDGEIAPRMPTEGLGLQSRLNLNYFDHNLQLQYRWMGPAYESLANSSIRRDIAGFRISDRFRTFNNTLYFTLGYENLNDNVLDTRDATTQTNVYRGNISWYPVDQQLPRISLNTRYQVRDNEVERLDNPYLADAGIDQSRAVRNILFTDDVEVVTRPRLTNTVNLGISVSQQFEFLNLSHDASVTFNRLNTTDQVHYFGDFSSNTFSFDISSRFRGQPLRIDFRTNFITTESMSGLNALSIAGFSTGGSYRFLDDQLTVRGELAYTRNTVESTPLTISELDVDPEEVEAVYTQYYRPGDITAEEVTNSYLMRGHAQYDITGNHAVVLSFRLNNIVAANFDQEVPNDNYVQLRYVLSF